MIVSGAVMGLVASVGGWLAFAVVVTVALLWRQALSARAEDVARACHELRGPLAAARLGVELSAARPVQSVARLRAIELELDRAAAALDDLQGVSRAAERAQQELVDVEIWLRDAVEAWGPVAARRGMGVELRWEGPPAQVEGERARLARATGNLIANAIEHGGGKVVVQGAVKEGRVFISVGDEGAGLSPELCAWLARDPGRRIRRPSGSRRDLGAPTPRASGPGRGRGLLITRAVAAAHGGRLRAEPRERGARLVLELPLAEPTVQGTRPGRQLSSAAGRPDSDQRPDVWRLPKPPPH